MIHPVSHHTTLGKTVQHCIPWTELVGIEKISGGFRILTRQEKHTFLFFFNLEETLHLVQVRRNKNREKFENVRKLTEFTGEANF